MPWNAASSSWRLLSTAASFSRDSVSGIPATHRPTTRTPCEPISTARLRMKVSMAASAGPVLPIIGLPWAEPLLSARMTPEPRSVMWRAAARAVMKFADSPVVAARVKSATVMSASGMPWTSPRETRLRDSSMPPSAATERACASTACSSSASTTATSAAPPAAVIVSANASSRS
jgi:hypothetical protein